MDEIPMTRLGTLFHAKGYIVNRLFGDERVGECHLPVRLLRQGYPPKYHDLLSKAFEELRTENPSVLHVRKKRTGRDTSLHVSLVSSRLKNIRGLMNAYRASVRLPRYGQDLKTLLPLPKRRSRTTCPRT